MFRFRLAGIMSLREYKERMCRDKLGQCQTNLREAEDRENEIKDAITYLGDVIIRAQEGVIDLPRLKLKYNYLDYMKERLILQKGVVALRKQELEEARLKLYEAMKEKKILQKLREKKYRQYQYEQNRLEQVLLDDLAGRRT